TGSIEATVFDGSGELVARWLGRRALSGIRLGTGLIIEGVTGVGDDGELVVLNPDYELVPGPEHGE
ncbi:MAG: DNA-binding protein, partial [Actinomycetota bacterium]